MNISYIAVAENGHSIKNIDLEIGVPLTIGRDDDNKLVLSSSKVSRFHCVISFNGTQWLLNDLQSTNGVLVNEKKRLSTVICDGDVIRIEPFTLIAHIPLPDNDTLLDNNLIDSVKLDETQAEDQDRTVYSRQVEPEDGTFIEEMAIGRESEPCIIVTNGRDQGVSIFLKNRILIGRAETCDLVLNDSAISRSHAEVQRDGRKYFLKSLSHGNPISCNGEVVERCALSDGDTLKLGDTELVVRLNKGGKGAKILRRPLYIFGISLLVVFFVASLMLFFRGVRSDLAQEGKALVEKGVEDTKTQKQGEISSSQNPDELDKKKQLSLLIKEAEMFASSGRYDKSINRLELYLQMVPDDKVILKAMDEYKSKLAMEEKKKADLITEDNEFKKKAEADLVKASESLIKKDFLSTIEVLDKIPKATSLPSSAQISKKIEAMRAKIQEEQEKLGSLQEKEKGTFQTAYEEIRSIFESGERAYNDKKYSHAKKAWEQVAASKLDVAERTQAVAQLKQLENLLKEKMEENYTKGLNAYKNKDYKNALRSWNSVVELYPDYKGVKAEYNAILAIQIEKSRHYYQTGLVYEGLNNLENAFSNWQKALDELQVENSEYYRKASAKLAEYGKQ